MAVIAHRVARYLHTKLPAGTSSEPFADQADIAGYALEVVKTLQQAGIIDGVEAQRFAPSETVSRAQAATIIAAAKLPWFFQSHSFFGKGKRFQKNH
ncbi:S-layer homology domain-containing protein [Paenibacillus filicis]